MKSRLRESQSARCVGRTPFLTECFENEMLNKKDHSDSPIRTDQSQGFISSKLWKDHLVQYGNPVFRIWEIIQVAEIKGWISFNYLKIMSQENSYLSISSESGWYFVNPSIWAKNGNLHISWIDLVETASMTVNSLAPGKRSTPSTSSESYILSVKGEYIATCLILLIISKL